MKAKLDPLKQIKNVTTGITSVNPTGNSSGTASVYYNTWNTPQRINVREAGESIEFIYKEVSMRTLTSYPSPPPEERVFKIVYSCVNGKWNKSERIYGNIIPPQDEYYEFED